MFKMMKKTIIMVMSLCGLVTCLSAQQTSIPVRIEEVKGSRQYYGFILSNGTMVVKPVYNYVHEFSEGLAAVKDTNKRWAFINTAGKKVFTLPATVEEVGDFSEGLCWFRDSKTDKVGFVDRTGKVVISPQWGFAHNFSDGLAAVGDGYTRDDHWFEIGNLKGYINHKGKLVIPLNIRHRNFSNNGGENFRCGRAIIEYEDKIIIIDKKGNELFGDKYRCANGIFSKAGLCCVAVADNEPCNAGDGNNDLPPCNLHWSVIDTSGRVVLDNVKVESFVDGLALVNLSNNPFLNLDDEGMVTLGDGKFIFMDTTGKRVFDRTFLQANSFSEGLAYVKEMDGTTGFINDKGEMVLLLPKGYAVYSNGFKNGIVEISHIEKRGKYTDHTTQWINREGQTVWKIAYRTWFN